MRISCLAGDPGYHLHFSACVIYLDGFARNNILTADENKRYALVEKRDEFGHPVRDKNGLPMTEDVWGACRIDCSDWLRDAMEPPQEEADTLSAAIFAMIATP